MSSSGLGRRTTLAGGAALAAASLIRPRESRAATRALTVVLESEVTILDPHYITATITRTFGLHVFDMLFAMNEKGEIKPQMVESWKTSDAKANAYLSGAHQYRDPFVLPSDLLAQI